MRRGLGPRFSHPAEASTASTEGAGVGSRVRHYTSSLILAAALAACGSTQSGQALPTRTALPATTAASTPTGAAQPPSSEPVRAANSARPSVVALDPGHNGGNAAAPAQINRLVPAGGFTKPCNTTGTAT